MSLGIIFALCCVLCSSTNDFIFKLYAVKSTKRGVLIFWIGVIMSLALFRLPPEGINYQATIFYGLLSGFFSVTANILLIDGMRHQSAGFSSLIYRLNLIPTVLAGVIILNESLKTIQWCGIACALIAIVIFGIADSKINTWSKAAKTGLIMVIIAALLRAAMGITYKYGFLHGADRIYVPWLNGICWVIGGILYALLREKDFNFLQKTTLKYGLFSGLPVVGIVFFMALSVFYGDASIVLPVAQMSFPLTFLLGHFILKEKCNIFHFFSLGLAIIAVYLLSR